MPAPRLLLIPCLAGGLAGCGLFAPSQEQVEQDVTQAAQEQAPEAPEQWVAAAESGALQTGWAFWPSPLQF